MSNPCVPHNYKNSRFVCFCHFGAIVGQQSHAVAVRVDCRHCLMGGCLRRRKVPRWACWPVGCMAPGGFTDTGRSCCRLGHGCRRGRSRLSSLIACPWKILAAPCTTHGAASGNPRSMCLWCKAVSLHDVYLRGATFHVFPPWRIIVTPSWSAFVVFLPSMVYVSYGSDGSKAAFPVDGADMSLGSLSPLTVIDFISQVPASWLVLV